MPTTATGVAFPLAVFLLLTSLLPWRKLADFVACRWPASDQWLLAHSGVPTCSWPAAGIDGLADAGQPRRLRGPSLPSAAWRAHQRWPSTDYLTSAFLPLQGVWRRPLPSAHASSTAEDRTFVYFAERGESGGRFGMRAPARAPPDTARVVEYEQLSVGTFLSAANSSDALLYCSHELSALGEAAVGDVEPLAPLELRTRSASSEDDQQRLTTRGIVWLGAGRPVTHAHYDTSHNVFVQVVGRKLFTLWPPSSLGALNIYPTRHSMHRQSSWADPPADAPADRLEVLLEAGDALYLPPFYAHHVAARCPSDVDVI